MTLLFKWKKNHALKEGMNIEISFLQFKNTIYIKGHLYHSVHLHNITEYKIELQNFLIQQLKRLFILYNTSSLSLESLGCESNCRCIGVKSKAMFLFHARKL